MPNTPMFTFPAEIYKKSTVLLGNSLHAEKIKLELAKLASVVLEPFSDKNEKFELCAGMGDGCIDTAYRALAFISEKKDYDFVIVSEVRPIDVGGIKRMVMILTVSRKNRK